MGGEETAAKLKDVFGKKPAYADIPGLCKAATLAEIEAQGWSLNPGRYVGVAPGEEVSDEDFKAQLEGDCRDAIAALVARGLVPRTHASGGTPLLDVC